MLVLELDLRFPAHHVMNAFGVFYPQYWCSSNVEEAFDSHLRTKNTYGMEKFSRKVTKSSL